jgi:hypothetical protein
VTEIHKKCVLITFPDIELFSRGSFAYCLPVHMSFKGVHFIVPYVKTIKTDKLCTKGLSLSAEQKPACLCNCVHAEASLIEKIPCVFPVIHAQSMSKMLQN